MTILLLWIFTCVFAAEWMICRCWRCRRKRYSFCNGTQQRGEDDISHILVNIIKANKTLEDKIKSNAAEKVIDALVFYSTM